MVLILRNREAFRKLSRQQVQKATFVAFGLDSERFLVFKNRMTGETGVFSVSCISSFFNVTWS